MLIFGTTACQFSTTQLPSIMYQKYHKQPGFKAQPGSRSWSLPGPHPWCRAEAPTVENQGTGVPAVMVCTATGIVQHSERSQKYCRGTGLKTCFF